MSGKVVLSFVLGAVGGAVGTYFGMKKACEMYISNEIEQFKADYEENHKCNCSKTCKKDENLEKKAGEALKKYSSATEKSISSLDTGKDEANLRVEKVNYTKISTPDIDKIDEIDVTKRVDAAIGPVTITPSEYMEDDGLKRIVCNYLPVEDKVYTENGEEEIVDGVELIGRENLDSFGEFEVDTLYVKNAREGIKIDCILYEDMTYEEFLQEL